MAALIPLARRFDDDPEHADQVTLLAALLFDLLAPERGLTPTDRELLLAAAVLHDIGYHLGLEQHNRKSATLIRELGLPGFSKREQAVIAALARYHRGAPPNGRHRRFAALSSRDQQRVRKLAAILRLADGLDRSHRAVVSGIGLEREGGGFRLLVAARLPASSELWAAEKKADLFAAVYGPVRIELAGPAQR